MINKILIVDDSAAVHQFYKMLLMRYKSEIISARNGQEGLNRLTTHSDVNLMIVDDNMPCMNGFEFIKKVKEQTAFNDVPIVFTSFEERKKLQDTLAITQGYLRKPFTSNELHTLIEQLFSACVSFSKSA